MRIFSKRKTKCHAWLKRHWSAQCLRLTSAESTRRRRRPQRILRSHRWGKSEGTSNGRNSETPFRENRNWDPTDPRKMAATTIWPFSSPTNSSPRSSNTSFPAKLGIWDKILSMNPKRQIPSSSCCAYTVLGRENMVDSFKRDWHVYKTTKKIVSSQLKAKGIANDLHHVALQ